jgi:hypothetical protein
MGHNRTLLLTAIDSAGLDDEAELIKAVGVLVGNWAGLAKEITGARSALELLRAIADGATDENIENAFKKVGAQDALATLQKGAARLTNLLEKVPDSVITLLEPIGTFDERAGGQKDRGLISWPLLDETVATPAKEAAEGEDSYSLSLGAKAALAIEAGDSWPYSDPVPEALVRIRADGGLEAKGDATLPFNIGKVAVGGGAAANFALEYYFAVPDQKSIYALAIGERLGKLVDPFDFNSVWDGFAGSDLAGVHYEFSGSTNVNVAVSVAAAADLGAAINANLGATISVGFKLDGKYFLTMRAGPRASDGSRQIIATLSRQKSSASDLGLKLGLTVDFSSIARKVHAVLADALGEWDKILKEVTPYLSPGTFLQGQAGKLIEKEAKALIKDARLRAALVRDLQGVIGIGEPTDSELVDWVTGQLTGALDAAQEWAKEKSKAAASLVDNLGRGLPAFAQDEIRTKLAGSADKLVDAAAKELADKVAALFAKDSRALDQALQRLDATAGKAVKTVDDALAGIRAIIDRYDKLFRKVVEATEDAARAKLSVAIQIEESRLGSTTIEVKGTFLRRSEGARDIFRALTRGDFNSLLKLFDVSHDGVDFSLDSADSSLRRYSGSTEKVGVEVVLFGFGITGSELLSAEAEVLVDGTGKVQVDAKASLKKRFKGLDAEREIELVSTFSLVWARALATAPPSADRNIGLAVTVGHIDDGLKRKEVERFVGSLVEAGLVGQPALMLAGDTFTRWIGNPGSNGRLVGALQLKLALDRKGLAQMLSIGDTVIPHGRAQMIVRSAFDKLHQKNSDREAMDGTIAFLQEKLPARSIEDLLMDPSGTRRSLLTKVTGSNIPRILNEDEPFMEAVEMSSGMLVMVEKLRQIYFSTPELHEDNDPRTWGPNDYRGAERAAVRAVRGWLQLNDVLFWTNSKVHRRTIAFLEMVASLAGLDIADALSLTLTRNGANESPETVVLSHAT